MQKKNVRINLRSYVFWNGRMRRKGCERGERKTDYNTGTVVFETKTPTAVQRGKLRRRIEPTFELKRTNSNSCARFRTLAIFTRKFS